jgi:hypothetical protein
MSPRSIPCAFFLAAALAQGAWSLPIQAVPSPSEHLGRPLGADFQLADWKEVSGYFAKLDAASERVRVEKVGTTTEGRDFLLAAITGERNFARLESIRAAAARIADPRGLSELERRKALEDAVPILMISNAMHSTEVAAPQFAMELAWKLATSDAEPYRSARENLLVLILPCTNPDGLDHVCEWYRRVVGTPYEAAGMTKLYQHYAGHDNNRDWFMLTQAETRIVTRLLYDEWHPHVYWDVHQQGQTAERLFVPPFRDPLDPNLDPAVMAGINLLGTRALLDMTRDGLSGVASGVTFDQWWNGGNRNVPVRHNILGLLTEAASCNLASPVFLEPSKLRAPGGKGPYAPGVNFPMPWPGGWWRVRDIVDYEIGFARSLLRSLASEPRTWIESALAAADRAIEKGREDVPRAWIVPSDNPDRGATRRLVDTLLEGGVELHVARGAVRADGREYPAGSLVILRDQPYGQHVKDLFEVQRYPDGDPPYDVAGWTLPMLLGVRRVECVERPEAELSRLAKAGDLDAAFGPRTAAPGFSTSESDDWTALFASLEKDGAATFDRSTAAFLGGAKEGDGRQVVKGMPRIGLYSPWSGSMDEGWMRWVFDTWKLPYASVRNEMLRAGGLDDFLDVLVIPSIGASQLDGGREPGSAPPEYTGGLDPEGAVAVEEFVRRGGTLIALGGSSPWAIELFELPLVDVTREKRKEGEPEFSCPGSVLRATPEDHLFTAGLPESVAVFFSGSSAWRIETRKGEEKDKRDLRVLLRFAPSRVLLSGWIRAPEVIEKQAAWVRVAHGEGAIHLFGFSPQYRGWSQQTFQLVFRAALLDG